MKRFRNIYLAFIGKLTIEAYKKLEVECMKFMRMYQQAQDRYLEQLKRADLAAKMYKESEAGRKAASDNLGDKIISQMLSDPSKFIPPKDKI